MACFVQSFITNAIHNRLLNAIGNKVVAIPREVASVQNVDQQINDYIRGQGEVSFWLFIRIIILIKLEDDCFKEGRGKNPRPGVRIFEDAEACWQARCSEAQESDPCARTGVERASAYVRRHRIGLHFVRAALEGGCNTTASANSDLVLMS